LRVNCIGLALSPLRGQRAPSAHNTQPATLYPKHVRLLRKKDELPKRSLWQRIKEVALMDVGVAVRGVETGSLERLEELLLEADFGVPVTLRLVEDVERLAKRGDVKTRDQFTRRCAAASRRRCERARAIRA
jgi:signal recognition particle GTPase